MSTIETEEVKKHNPVPILIVNKDHKLSLDQLMSQIFFHSGIISWMSGNLSQIAFKHSQIDMLDEKKLKMISDADKSYKAFTCYYGGKFPLKILWRDSSFFNKVLSCISKEEFTLIFSGTNNVLAIAPTGDHLTNEDLISLLEL